MVITFQSLRWKPSCIAGLRARLGEATVSSLIHIGHDDDDDDDNDDDDDYDEHGNGNADGNEEDHCDSVIDSKINAKLLTFLTLKMIMMMFEVKRAIYKNVPQRIVMASIMGIYGHNRDEDIDDKDNFSISNKKTWER